MNFFSVNTDATHFTSCKGVVSLENCIFSAQGDDSVNIHTYFHNIEYLGPRTCKLCCSTDTHSRGLDHPDEGDILELTELKSLRVLSRYRVLTCAIDPAAGCTTVTLDQPLPADPTGYVFANISQLPRFVFTGNRCSNHYARGLVIKTRDVLIENNVFEKIFGTAIKCAAASWWGEGVNPADIHIRNNCIFDCARRSSFKGAGGISVTADADTDEIPAGSLISNVAICGNEIVQRGSPYGIYVSHADGVSIHDNRIEAAVAPAMIEHCTNVDYHPLS